MYKRQLVNSEGKVIGVNTLKLSGEDIEGMGFAIPINSTTAVSYTHLDVYKRQEFLKFSLICIILFFLSFFSTANLFVTTLLINIFFNAVSYTHLDVYKRQVTRIGISQTEIEQGNVYWLSTSNLEKMGIKGTKSDEKSGYYIIVYLSLIHIFIPLQNFSVYDKQKIPLKSSYFTSNFNLSSCNSIFTF